MKGIETRDHGPGSFAVPAGSDHCPAMKGIETLKCHSAHIGNVGEATTAPQ